MNNFFANKQSFPGSSLLSTFIVQQFGFSITQSLSNGSSFSDLSTTSFVKIPQIMAFSMFVLYMNEISATYKNSNSIPFVCGVSDNHHASQLEYIKSEIIDTVQKQNYKSDQNQRLVQDFFRSVSMLSIFPSVYLLKGIGGGGKARYGLFRYVPLWRVRFSTLGEGISIRVQVLNNFSQN